MKIIKFRSESLWVIPALMLGIPLALYAFTGLYVRYMADDYCTAAVLGQRGFWGSQLQWYQQWSGRYSFSFLIGLVESIGSRSSSLLTLFFLMIFMVCLVFVLRDVFDRYLTHLRWEMALLLALLIVHATYAGTPDLYQSLFWQTGLLTYSAPLILFMFLLWMLWRVMQRNPKLRSCWPGILVFGIAFIAAGFSETYASMQTAGLLLGVLLMLIRRRSGTFRREVVLALIGSLFGVLLMVKAPGNAVRMQLMPARPSWTYVVFYTARHALAFIAKSLLRAPLSNALAFLLPAWLSVWISNNGWFTRHAFLFKPRIFFGIILLGYCMIAAAILPSVYATAAYPADRALVTAQFILVITALVSGFLFGSWISARSHSPRKMLILLLVSLLFCAGSVARASLQGWHWMYSLQEHARQYQMREDIIAEAKSQGKSKLAVPSLPHLGGLDEVSDDAENWINNCLESFYGLEEITAR